METSQNRVPDLPQFRSHKIVRAAKIERAESDLSKLTVNTGSETFDIAVLSNFFGRGVPDVGDYLVVYEDGYMSWSPVKVFEEGYTPVEP